MLAYLELGGSSMYIQMAIATLVSVPFLLRSHIGRGIEKLRRRNRK